MRIVGITLIVLEFSGRRGAPRLGAALLSILLIARMCESDLSLLGSTVDHLPRSASFMKCHHAGRDRRADAVLERAYQRERQPISARVPKGARHLVVGLVGQPPLSGPLAVVIEIQWFMRHSGFPRSRLGQGR